MEGRKRGDRIGIGRGGKTKKKDELKVKEEEEK